MHRCLEQFRVVWPWEHSLLYVMIRVFLSWVRYDSEVEKKRPQKKLRAFGASHKTGARADLPDKPKRLTAITE